MNLHIHQNYHHIGPPGPFFGGPLWATPTAEEATVRTANRKGMAKPRSSSWDEHDPTWATDPEQRVCRGGTGPLNTWQYIGIQ